MKITLPLVAAASFALAIPALADEPRAQDAETATEQTTEEQAAPAESEQNEAAPAAIEVPAVEPVEEEERICRRIRTDMSSRRATRVCMTREEWREFNQQR